jgi:starch phosphorylase
MHCFVQIIYNINTIFLEEVKSKFGNDYDRLARLSIVDEGEKKASFNPSLLVLNRHLFILDFIGK